MSLTKRELLKLLESFDDDLPIAVGIEYAEAGTQHCAVGVCYATGKGLGDGGGAAIVIEYEYERADPDLPLTEEEEDLVIKCPKCGEEIL